VVSHQCTTMRYSGNVQTDESLFKYKLCELTLSLY